MSHGLAGVDGLDQGPAEPPRGPDPGRPPLRLAPDASAIIRGEVERAGGREVCFLCDVTDDRLVVRPRAVARGNRAAVLAVARDAPEGSILVHNHPSGVLEPSDADLSVAARVWEAGLGTGITGNDGADLYVVVEPPEPRVRVDLDPDALDAEIGPGGPLSRLHAGYEDRDGQRRMLRLVTTRFNEGGIAIVEAGTGTGKSLAYLLPAARWALANGERTVVSTNTINLQEQLVRKDLPLVGRLTAGDDDEASLTWALVKGRGNYLSIRRAHLAMESAPSLFEEDRTDELTGILEWATSTEHDGSLQDLPFVPSSDAWEEVQSDPDICLRGKCPHFQECFYQRSRRRAASADVVVVNHHLLFTDLAVRRATNNWTQSAVLPAYDRLVLDEAHNLEDAATSHLGVEVTRSALMRMLSRLDRRGKGILSAVQEGLRGRGERAIMLSTLVEEKVRPTLEETRSAALAFIETVEPLIATARSRGEGEAVRIGEVEGEGTLPEPAADELVKERLDRLLGALSRLERLVGDLRRRVDAEEELAEALEGRLLDLQSVERRLAAHHYALSLVLTPTEDEARSFVRWIEVRGSGRRSNLVLAAAPIELGPLLRESLFAHTDTIVLSSATLATRKSFDFLRGRIGLDAEGLASMEDPPVVVEEIVPSPFDFASQVVFGVPTDLPDPRVARDPGGDGELQAGTARVTAELAGLTDGGLFVLFTSYRALRRVAGHLRADGVDQRWPLFVQGEDERARLLQDFVRTGDGILLGTSSFWEGVDVPGHPLRGLIIQKLPFRVPTEPVTAARVEAIEARGGNPFWEFMLPLAALRLKQGFGRLIRSRTDRGAVLLLDDRILRRRYGRYLLDSLPDAPLARGPWPELERRLREFYET